MRSTDPDTPLQVALAVVCNDHRRILISQRGAARHLGGAWEFPGGKLDPGETPKAALARELLEETGLICECAEPLVRLTEHYPASPTHAAQTVALHCFRVIRYRGTAESRIGQPLQWINLEQLKNYPMPAINRAIVTALRLPHQYPISPPCGAEGPFLEELSRFFASGCPLYCLRQPQLQPDPFRRLATAVIELGRRSGTEIILNGAPELATALGAAGVHLNRHQLMAANQRPLPANMLVGASCHNGLELRQARRIGADYALLSPVQRTGSHPGVEPLGWTGFSQLLAQAGLPVYALGGMQPADLQQARERGAVGIAGISCFRRITGTFPH
ncbi:MAG: Nudix family hydrolase [Gammaproteobacteria bacterium]|nr:Nudix family hydrolase [Gammaproteobacteria bacterium]